MKTNTLQTTLLLPLLLMMPVATTPAWAQPGAAVGKTTPPLKVVASRRVLVGQPASIMVGVSNPTNKPIALILQAGMQVTIINPQGKPMHFIYNVCGEMPTTLQPHQTLWRPLSLSNYLDEDGVGADCAGVYTMTVSLPGVDLAIGRTGAKLETVAKTVHIELEEPKGSDAAALSWLRNKLSPPNTPEGHKAPYDLASGMYIHAQELLLNFPDTVYGTYAKFKKADAAEKTLALTPQEQRAYRAKDTEETYRLFREVQANSPDEILTLQARLGEAKCLLCVEGKAEQAIDLLKELAEVSNGYVAQEAAKALTGATVQTALSGLQSAASSFSE